MKRIMIFLMFLILVSGMAYSRTVYLVVPASAGSLTYYAVDNSGNNVSLTDSTTTSYLGNSKLNLVTLTTSSESTFKMVAGYVGSDSKYYYLVSPDAEEDDIKAKLTANTSGTNSDVFNGVSTIDSSKFKNYSSYPGIKITEDVRLSLVPVTGAVTNKREFSSGTSINGIAGISPSSSTDKMFVMITEYDEDTTSYVYALKKNDKDDIELDTTMIKYVKNTDYSTETSKKGEKTYSLTGSATQVSKAETVYNANYVQFGYKKPKINDKNRDDSDNTDYKYNTYPTLEDVEGPFEGDMTVTIFNEKYEKVNGNAYGQFNIYITGTIGAGDTIVLLEDTGVSAENGIAVKSKVNNKSRARDTSLKTSLIGSDNFIIENIKE